MTSRRRDPYDRALTAATKRLERAMKEQDRCREKNQTLADEIPRLQQIIAVLSSKPSPMSIPPPSTDPIPVPGIPGGVPAHLERYLKGMMRGAAVAPAQTVQPESIDDDLPPISGDPVLE